MKILILHHFDLFYTISIENSACVVVASRLKHQSVLRTIGKRHGDFIRLYFSVASATCWR